MRRHKCSDRISKRLFELALWLALPNSIFDWPRVPSSQYQFGNPVTAHFNALRNGVIGKYCVQMHPCCHIFKPSKVVRWFVQLDTKTYNLGSQVFIRKRWILSRFNWMGKVNFDLFYYIRNPVQNFARFVITNYG